MSLPTGDKAVCSPQEQKREDFHKFYGMAHGKGEEGSVSTSLNIAFMIMYGKDKYFSLQPPLSLPLNGEANDGEK